MSVGLSAANHLLSWTWFPVIITCLIAVLRSINSITSSSLSFTGRFIVCWSDVRETSNFARSFTCEEGCLLADSIDAKKLQKKASLKLRNNTRTHQFWFFTLFSLSDAIFKANDNLVRCWERLRHRWEDGNLRHILDVHGVFRDRTCQPRACKFGCEAPWFFLWGR